MQLVLRMPKYSGMQQPTLQSQGTAAAECPISQQQQEHLHMQVGCTQSCSATSVDSHGTHFQQQQGLRHMASLQQQRQVQQQQQQAQAQLPATQQPVLAEFMAPKSSPSNGCGVEQDADGIQAEGIELQEQGHVQAMENAVGI